MSFSVIIGTVLGRLEMISTGKIGYKSGGYCKFENL